MKLEYHKIKSMKKPSCYKIFDEYKQKYIMPKTYVVDRFKEMELNNLTEEQWEYRVNRILENRWVLQNIRQQNI